VAVEQSTGLPGSCPHVKEGRAGQGDRAGLAGPGSKVDSSTRSKAPLTAPAQALVLARLHSLSHVPSAATVALDIYLHVFQQTSISKAVASTREAWDGKAVAWPGADWTATTIVGNGG
jgi:hypothetical protein